MYYYGGGSCGCPQGYPTYQMPYPVPLSSHPGNNIPQ